MTITGQPAIPTAPPLQDHLAEGHEPRESPPPPRAPRPGRLRRFFRGRPDDPRWVRPSLLALLAGTLVLYTWNLAASGWANSFYSAAAQAGSVSWKAFLFGSSDAANSITIDKPPMFLWPQALSVRVFGLNSWSILVPQALMGVASVGVLYAAVRRWFTPAAGLLAGAVMALTPVAALMFRFNNPDALLTLLLTVAAYTALRAIDDGRARWFILTGIAIGFGFLTKQLQVLLVVPPFALAYLLAGRAAIGRRIADLGLAFAAMVAAGGWWVALVELWPASSRPYIGGSQTNSFLELTFGYNGFGRLTGNETGSVGGGGPGLQGAQGGQGGGIWGATGITRLFDNEIGGQIAWLLPAALVLLVVGFWLTRRAARTDLQRAALVIWGGWLLVTALTFSFMAGIFHAYYTVALAPAIGALVGIGATMLWAHRAHWGAKSTMAGLTVLTGLWAAALLGRAPTWNPWLAETIVLLSVLSAVGFVVSAVLPGENRVAAARLTSLAAIVAVAVALAAPAAWTLETVINGREGSLVNAGPTVETAGRGGAPGHPGQVGPGQVGPGHPGQVGPGQVGPGQVGPGQAGPGQVGPGTAQVPGTGPPGQGAPGTAQVPGAAGPGQGAPGTADPGQGVPGQGGNVPGPGAGGDTGGGRGGLLNGVEVSDEMVALLSENAAGFTWVAATTGSQNASSYQLATELPVMPIGGFNGSDPSPTLAQFQEYVSEGQIHYYIASGLSGANSRGGSEAAREIASWVEDNFTATTVGNVTVYDLTLV
ncbi:MAG: hypothetical protein JJLCMIEE_02496 [Acidimicrobiales bacterium]|nr:MAG: glycosyl transferase [Actinomycetota bacterium]MBV6509405.1 hypothetical protein [Acidimicrobiales bacterium]RIK06728.1 MAG: glycosyl transferase [Acidobacteriota bacterium]